MAKEHDSKTKICLFLVSHIDLKCYSRYHRLDEVYRSGLLGEFRWEIDAGCWLPHLLRGDSVWEAVSKAFCMRVIYKMLIMTVITASGVAQHKHLGLCKWKLNVYLPFFCVRELSVQLDSFFVVRFFILPSRCQLTALGCVTSDSIAVSLFLSVSYGTECPAVVLCIVCAVGDGQGSTGLPLFNIWQRGVPQFAFVCPSSSPLFCPLAPYSAPVGQPGHRQAQI